MRMRVARSVTKPCSSYNKMELLLMIKCGGGKGVGSGGYRVGGGLCRARNLVAALL